MKPRYRALRDASRSPAPVAPASLTSHPLHLVAPLHGSPSPTSTRSCRASSPAATRTGRSCSSTSSRNEERLHLTGPDGSRVYGFNRDYTWFIREGFFVRSPLEVRRRHDRRERSAPGREPLDRAREGDARSAREERAKKDAADARKASWLGRPRPRAFDVDDASSSRRSSRGSCRPPTSSASSSIPATTRSPAARS